MILGVCGRSVCGTDATFKSTGMYLRRLLEQTPGINDLQLISKYAEQLLLEPLLILFHSIMQPAYPDTAIILFAKEPIPGKVKTRLIPVLGVKNATRLYDQMLRHTINTVVDIDLAVIYLYITPESNPQYFHSIAFKHNFQIRIQQGNNLGEKMFNALNQTLMKYKRTILIGTDCPFLNADDLHEAIKALDTDQPHNNTMVFSPAHDGGYVLVGASRVCQEVFQDIEWGTEKVMSQTRSVLEYKQIQWRELNKQQDIDTCEDLSALSQLNGFQHIKKHIE